MGNLPALAHEGETVHLTVQVSGDAARGRSDKLDIAVPPEGVFLDIVVTAPNFELVKGPATTKLFVPQTGDSGFVSFCLRALKFVSGKSEAQVHVAAVHHGTNVAALTLPITLTGAAPVPGPPTVIKRGKFSANGVRPGDASLFIDLHQPSMTYSFLWLDADGSQELAYSSKVYKDLVDFIGNTAAQIEEIARLDYNVDLESARIKLKAYGTKLWELLPEKIRDRLIDRWDELEHLSIISSGDPIPWEMLYPYRKKPPFDGGLFLVEKVQIRRWVHGSLPPGTIGLNRADFVVADPSQLQQAAGEVMLIKQALAQWNAELSPSTISAADEFYMLFSEDLLNLLHVACHQSFESDSERIVLKNTPVGPDDFGNFQLTALPFIFMNACRSDSKVPSYNKIGGWANAFLDIGAGAFIGTLWEVRDTTAQIFANTLYAELLQNRTTFGTALKSARAAAKEKAPGDPTWLAYTFYGDTEARFGDALSPNPQQQGT